MIDTPFVSLAKESKDLRNTIEKAILSFIEITGIHPQISIDSIEQETNSGVYKHLKVSVSIPLDDENIILKLNLHKNDNRKSKENPHP